MKTFIYSPSPISLVGIGLKRIPRRPPELQGDHFSEQFDYTTLFYDVCQVGNSVYLSGPPTYDIFRAESAVRWRIGDGSDWRNVQPALKDVNKCQQSWIHDSPQSAGRQLSVSIGENEAIGSINGSYIDCFAGRRVLLTTSKDNKLEWIRDWVTYHVACHDVDAVLFYDNNSHAYDVQQVLDTITVPGIELAVVVPWNYKYGPQGGTRDGIEKAPWDSEFCQLGVLEHARWVFLSQASMVINTDIDELIVTPDARSIREWLEESEAGILHYHGYRIESESKHVDEIPRYFNFQYRKPVGGVVATKWSIDPRRTSQALQWCTHVVRGYPTAQPLHGMFRDFRAINTGWKLSSRTIRRDNIPADYQVDEVAVAALMKAFPEAYPDAC